MGEKLFVIVEGQVINAEERTQLENLLSVAIRVIIDTGENHGWKLESLGEKAVGYLQTPISQMTYDYITRVGESLYHRESGLHLNQVIKVDNFDVCPTEGRLY